MAWGEIGETGRGTDWSVRIQDVDLGWAFGLLTDEHPSCTYGEVKVPTNLRSTVAYLASRDEEGSYAFAGTVFFVGHGKPGERFCDRVFAVTARHVLEGIYRTKTNKSIYLRFNLRGGKFEWIETKLTDWHFIQNSEDDVAILERGIPEQHDHLVLPFQLCKTTDQLTSDGIGLGDEAVIVGLYSSHPGEDRNIPIVRIGNISVLEPQHVYNKQVGHIRGILIEVRSLGGLSGSPVFVQYGYWRITSGRLEIVTGDNLMLIGMVHGHHEVSISRSSTKEDRPAEIDHLNTGIAIVVPFEEIRKVILDYNAKAGGSSLDY